MKRLTLPALIITLLLSSSVHPAKRTSAATAPAKKSVTIWRQPSDIRTLNLFYGPGGSAGQPHPPFRFVEEDRDGSSPKIVVTDARGIRWKVKLGDEAKPETAATRLLWAVGYFSDTTYYLPHARVIGLPKLSRGEKYVSAGGTLNGARFEHSAKKIDDWSWFENPFIGTREFNGLRVMMALMNCWDLKQSNNAVYQINHEVSDGRLAKSIRTSGYRNSALRVTELRYAISDLGATFGKTGGDWTRSKGDVDDYVSSKFIDKVTSRDVDLVMHSRPPFVYAPAVPYYLKRVRMEKVSEDIPRSHARWIGQLLGQLSNAQLRDLFRGAGYSPTEAEMYARKVRERINELNRL
jgi:hypothetical protein